MTERIRVDDILELLPDLDELAPLLDEVMASAGPDPDRIWAGSGELETLGRRRVDAAALKARVPTLVEECTAHLERVFTGVAAAVEALAAGDREGAARALLAVGEQEEARERPDRAYRYALSAHGAARALRDRTLASLALRRAARAARALGRLGEAAALYERAWQDARDGNDRDGLVVACIGRGNVAVDRGLWSDAREWYDRALEHLPEEAPPRAERWHVLQNLGIVHREEGRLDACRAVLTEAEEVARALGDPAAEVEVNNGWGQLLMAEGDLPGAEARFRAALAAARDARSRAVVWVNLGEVLLARGRILEAEEAGREAETAALRGRIMTRLPEIYRFLGRLARERSPDHAFVFYERALAVIEERRLPAFERAVTAEEYAEARLRGGETGLAAGLLREALRIRTALGMTEHARKAALRLAELGEREPEAQGEEGIDRPPAPASTIDASNGPEGPGVES